MKKLFVLSAAAAMALPASAQATVFVYSGTGGAITDLGTLTRTINVTNAFSLAGVTVTLTGLTHTYWADLDITLSNGTTTIDLTSDNGGSSDPNGNFTFSDAATLSMTNSADVLANLSGGTFKPEQALSAFIGNGSAGTWTLKIVDDAAIDVGNLVGWTLRLDNGLTPPGTPLVPEPGTWALMFAGFGLVGVMLRREKPRTRVRFEA